MTVSAFTFSVPPKTRAGICGSCEDSAEIPGFSSRSNRENATSRSACFCLYCLLS